MSQRSIDELVDLLSSEDLKTRFLAEMCLRDATSVLTRFSTGEFAAEESEINRKMARLVQRTRREV